MAAFRIGCVQITWKNVPRDQVLREIVEAGYEGVPAGPQKGKSTQEVLDDLAGYGLDPAPTYLGGDFWQKETQADGVERARRIATFAREAGITELYVATGGSRTFVGSRGLNRMQVAGRVQPEDGLSDAEFKQLAETLNMIGEVTLAEGVSICFHNHVASVIETREEIDRLFSLVDRELVFLGPDTGHLAWGGCDVVETFRDYADSIKTVHLKDIDADVMAEGRQKEWDSSTCREHGVYIELGQGFLDFPGMMDVLKGAGFDGWLLAETDVTQLPTALESAVVSRNYLRDLQL